MVEAKGQGVGQLLGQWRIEVTTVEENKQNLFLHLIQAGDRNLGTMVESELVKDGDRVGVRFSDGSKEWTVLFGTDGDASGHVTIRQGGSTIVDRELTQKVAQQKGLFGTE